ncbi:hypothetical protein [Halorussus lipolyticus]|uniref:hypothetical protein n=1 Tax=Halorussus lipolyticus TaxID=3034024 RepID=UPI0023E88985|nr:hypothetical protein [Halorussus sp. DT80]
MNRRSFLKSVGTGSVASFTVGATASTASAASREWINSFEYGDPSAYDSVNVEIYKPTYVDSKHRYWARLGAQDVFGQATDNGYISGYEITEWNIDFSVDCDGDILTQWDDYRTNEGWTADGSHFLAVNCGGSPAGKASAGDAWKTDRSCYAKTYGNDKDKLAFKHTSAHEMLHNHLSSLACSEVQSLTGPDNSEHSLGDVFSIDGQDLETPMAGKNHWADGDCAYYGDTYDGRTMELSPCTQQALEDSAEHWDNQH